jgi:hypothetical protein
MGDRSPLFPEIEELPRLSSNCFTGPVGRDYDAYVRCKLKLGAKDPFVYFVILMDGKRLVPIDRFLGQDCQGILYIGSAVAHGTQRVRGWLVEASNCSNAATTESWPSRFFWKCIKPKKAEWHIGVVGVQVDTTGFGNQEVIRKCTYKKELDYRQRYREKFGEYPPFNRQK